MTEFKLPNLGDGVAAGDVLRVLVKVGDTLAADQAVLELETDKATLEVPTSDIGRTRHRDQGQAGRQGDARPGRARGRRGRRRRGNAPAPGAARGCRPLRQGHRWPADDGSSGPGQADGPIDRPMMMAVERSGSGRRPDRSADGWPRRWPRLRRAAERHDKVLAFQASKPVTAATGAEQGAGRPRRRPQYAGWRASSAWICIRCRARGAGGRISQDDVKTFTKNVMASLGGGGQRAVATVSGASVALPDFSKWGAVERKAMSGIRRKTGEHLSHAWNTIPHVTQFDKADITNLEAVRKQYRAEVEKAGGNLTVTSILTKIVAGALKTFPQFNASVDAAGEAIVYKKYVHVGIAVDTENGLLVPVVRNADQKNLTQISVDIQVLAEKAKARKLTLDEMSGGSMSISNLGGIGGTAFTPIVNWPEVAILGVSRGAMEPKWNGSAFEPRQMLPLSLSYDHRLIDGADAIRFLRWVVDALENPFALALRG